MGHQCPPTSELRLMAAKNACSISSSARFFSAAVMRTGANSRAKPFAAMRACGDVSCAAISSGSSRVSGSCARPLGIPSRPRFALSCQDQLNFLTGRLRLADMDYLVATGRATIEANGVKQAGESQHS
jgi:hypothetical protein